MTVYTYYFVYGYFIKREDLMRILGYTDESLTDEWIEENKVEIDKQIGEDVERKHILEWKFKLEQYEEGCVYVGEIRLTIQGKEFIARGFTHDDKRDGDFVIGIDCGKVDVESGEMTKGNMDPSEYDDYFDYLLYNEEYDDEPKEDSEEEDEEYTEYGKLLLNQKYCNDPKTYMTTNDCTCCS